MVYGVIKRVGRAIKKKDQSPKSFYILCCNCPNSPRKLLACVCCQVRVPFQSGCCPLKASPPSLWTYFQCWGAYADRCRRVLLLPVGSPYVFGSSIPPCYEYGISQPCSCACILELDGILSGVSVVPFWSSCGSLSCRPSKSGSYASVRGWTSVHRCRRYLSL